MRSSTEPAPRASGVLLHISSLPGAWGIGDLGPEAHRWIDLLARARQRWWQMLPLAPPSTGNSPYNAFSAFAGNPLLISPQLLVKDGLLRRREVSTTQLPDGKIHFAAVARIKSAWLSVAWERFSAHRPSLAAQFRDFVLQQRHWLDDYALFMALRSIHPGRSWPEWPAELARRNPSALAAATRSLSRKIEQEQFTQFLFFRQLRLLRRRARDRNVGLIGDLPIFVSAESADVWAHPHLFLLDRQLRPRVVAGVPPDYFSRTGQRWGNPLYDWKAMQRDGFAWWKQRVRALLDQVDLIRIDHFRGFSACWQIPCSHRTAENGRWSPTPGLALFQSLRNDLGRLPFIAEDLGEITPDVQALRRQLNLPGMRVLHFAFGSGPANPFLPHNYERRTVVYTGTHDNDTTRHWYRGLSQVEKAQVRRYVPHANAASIAWELVRLAWMSVAELAIAPAQDLTGRGVRMNTPGQARGNWSWRMNRGEFNDEVVDRLRELTQAAARA